MGRKRKENTQEEKEGKRNKGKRRIPEVDSARRSNRMKRAEFGWFVIWILILSPLLCTIPILGRLRFFWFLLSANNYRIKREANSMMLINF